jgi:hypothetical protein
VHSTIERADAILTPLVLVGQNCEPSRLSHDSSSPKWTYCVQLVPQQIQYSWTNGRQLLPYRIMEA